jgi:hypothetical protein
VLSIFEGADETLCLKVIAPGWSAAADPTRRDGALTCRCAVTGSGVAANRRPSPSSRASRPKVKSASFVGGGR